MESLHRESLSEIINIPNVATFTRLVIAGHVSYVLLNEGPSIALGTEYATGMLLDAFDGWYARKFDRCTKFGKIFDPIVDFLSFHLPLLAYGGSHVGSGNLTQALLPIGASLFIAARDLTLFQQYLQTPKIERDGYCASRVGKIKTWVQMGTVTLLITAPESSQEIQKILSQHIEDIDYAQLREGLVKTGLLSSIAFSLFSGFGYWKRIQERVSKNTKVSQK